MWGSCMHSYRDNKIVHECTSLVVFDTTSVLAGLKLLEVLVQMSELVCWRAVVCTCACTD